MPIYYEFSSMEELKEKSAYLAERDEMDDLIAVASIKCPICEGQTFFLLPEDDIILFMEDGRSFPEFHLPYMPLETARRLQDGYCDECIRVWGPKKLKMNKITAPKSEWFKTIIVGRQEEIDDL